MGSFHLQHPTQHEIFLSTDRSLVDVSFVHYQLSTQHYWCKGITLEIITTGITNSLPIGLYDSNAATANVKPKQIGFARWVTDYATFGCLADVFVVPEYQGRGLGAWVVQEAEKMEEVAQCRRLMLVTKTPGFYERLGWEKCSDSVKVTGVSAMETRRDTKVLYGLGD